MDSFSIVMTIAIILFTRLGVRLVTRYIKMKKEGKEEKEDQENNNNQL
jgi:Na+/phosphate symporter